jgi:hypothetical protein
MSPQTALWEPGEPGVRIDTPDCALGVFCVTPQTALWEPRDPGVGMDIQTALWVCLETF